ALPLHQGLHGLRDGLRLGVGLGLPCHDRTRYGGALLDRALLGALLGRRRPLMTVSPARTRLAEAGRIIVLLAILAVVLYPLLWMIGSSFKSQHELLRAEDAANLFPTEFSPSNYPDGWSGLGESFATFFRNSILLSGLAVVGNILSCMLAAYAFS